MRPAKERIVEKPPKIQGMKPMGVPGRLLEKISLSIDEYEAIRLSDFEGMDHKASSEYMNISRPTFTRLLQSGHQKIADAIVNVKDLIIEGGNYSFTKILIRCLDCKAVSDIGAYHTDETLCPECNSTNVVCLNNVFQPGHCNRRRNFGGHGFRNQ
ncbi:MAG: DUF134 domain-containing protein [Candidatus Marinimicrobia bacterium]|nr:DUF134 domain-containing protein [Candidatus Neomarinimicrobiota bacterium]